MKEQNKNQFPYDYDVNNLLKLTLEGFSMFITKRYAGHYFNNKYERFSSDLFLNFIKEDSVVVDVGANYGYYSLLAHSKNRNGKIYSIEPVKENLEVLSKSIKENSFKNIYIIDVAISDFIGEAEFNVTEASDSAGFYEHPFTKTYEKRTVKVETLDNLFKDKKIDILKIDTEGNEIKVIQGAKNVIKNNPQMKIFIEFAPLCLKMAGENPDSLISTLINYGFSVIMLNEDIRKVYELKKGSDWQNLISENDYCNLLCVKDDKGKLFSMLSYSFQINEKIFKEFFVKDNELDRVNQELFRKDEEIKNINNLVDLKNEEIEFMKSSRFWKVKTFYEKFKNPILVIFKKINKIPSFLKKEGIKNAIPRSINYLQYVFSRKRNDTNSTGGCGRTIANNSRQILKQNYFDFLFKEIKSKSPVLYEEKEKISSLIKAIAFYLPQFHPIPENDLWWGNGFTEWTNVSKAIPQFAGHNQPLLPGDLGFYDLRNIEIQKKQIELAKNYGLYGFCYHYYWFSGKKLLEKPLEQLLNHPELDFPFCINWANENWSRRWDGKDSDILISQKYRDEDAESFIKTVSELFKDKRYIRINGKPLLLIYYPVHIPDIKVYVDTWRNYCRKSGIGEIYLVASHSINIVDPTDIGFDAAVEFSPNNSILDKVNNKVFLFNKNYKGNIFDYNQLVDQAINFKKPKYKKFRGICPSWDNEARKPGNGTTFINANPDIYGKWLKVICDYTIENFSKDERFIFINAWNEWAEGAVLEPSRKFGYEYLEKTYQVISECKNYVTKKIIYVGHDAAFNGAQILSLSILKELKERFKFSIYIILKSGGVLEKEYEKYATVYNLSEKYTTKDQQIELIKKIKDLGVDYAITSTVISGDIVELLKKENIKTLSLIHELTGVIKQYKAEEYAKIIARQSDYVIFPSNFVRDHYNKIAPVPENKTFICPQGLLRENKYKNDKKFARNLLRKNLKLKEDAFIVLGVAYADYRKGIDLFLEVASKISNEKINFVWVGDIAPEMQEIVSNKMKTNKNVYLIKTTSEISLFYAGADIYLMTSREEPFGSVVIESMNVGVPVVGFKDVGGFADIVTKETGILIPNLDIDVMAKTLEFLIKNKNIIEKLGRASESLINNNFIFKDYIYSLLNIMGINYKKVSVIVPNYNYANYIQRRLDAIISQTYPIYQILVLDDMSSDNSVSIIQKYIKTSPIEIELDLNKKNSGSVFKQWAKGIKMCKGDYLWIAEVDDLSMPNFLEVAMKGFNNEKVVLSYTQSKIMNKKGQIIENNYLNYTDDIDQRKWESNYVISGKEEIANSLAVKNTILNVSGVIFKKRSIDDIPEDFYKLKVAGDWFFYVWLLSCGGDVAYNSESLNIHCRHDDSTSGKKGTKLEKHMDEIIFMQNYIENKTNLSLDVKQKMQKYRERISKYLGIN